MEGIYEPNDIFDFKKLFLVKPIVMNGNNFFIRYLMNERPLYIQPPKCILKQGFIRAGKKIYCDFVFTNENVDFIRWIENLETISQVKVFENREKWFETELEMHDIENSFTSPLKIFKSGKCYVLRVNVPCVMGVCNLKIYDENENEINPENLNENENIMAILEVKGIKCSSRSFQIEFELKQLMVLKPIVLFDKCIFKSQNKQNLGNDGDDTKDEKKMPDDDVELSISDQTMPVEENLGTSTEVFNEKDSEEELAGKNDDNIEHIFFEYEDKKEDVALINIPEPSNMNDDFNEETKQIIEPVMEIVGENNENILQEIHFNLDELPPDDVVSIKNRNDVYYKLYTEALLKARTARDLALSNYLEAKHIKNTYLLQELNHQEETEIFN